MPLGKRLGRPPRDIADRDRGRLQLDDLCEPPEVAGPGFINLRLRDDWLIEQLDQAGQDAAAGDRPGGRAAHVRDRLLVAERGQGDARGAHPLDGDRRRPVPHARGSWAIA